MPVYRFAHDPWKSIRLKAVICLTLLPAVSGCSGLFYQPDRYVYFPPELNGYQEKNVYFRAQDGSRVHAWYFAAKKPQGTVILFHGNGQNLTAHYASLIWLVEQGYNLFVFDYRGYGESMAREAPDQKGVYLDGRAALDQAWSLHQASGARRFVVYGQSLGGAIAMRCFADFAHRDATDLIVMDSTFLSYKDVAQQTLERSWVTWLLNPLGRLFVSDEYAPRAADQALKARLLVIHDRHDPVVGFRNGQQIYELAPARKDFWELDQGRHAGVFADEKSPWREKFVGLLGSL